MFSPPAFSATSAWAFGSTDHVLGISALACDVVRLKPAFLSTLSSYSTNLLLTSPFNFLLFSLSDLTVYQLTTYSSKIHPYLVNRVHTPQQWRPSPAHLGLSRGPPPLRPLCVPPPLAHLWQDRWQRKSLPETLHLNPPTHHTPQFKMPLDHRQKVIRHRQRHHRRRALRPRSNAAHTHHTLQRD